MKNPRIAVNMLWCLPGRVGGSEEYFVRQLLGLAQIDAPFEITVFAPKEFLLAHPDVALAHRVIEANSSCLRREMRVALENSWLANKTRNFDAVHHGGGTLPSLGNRVTLLTVHDVQYLSYPSYFSAVKLRYLRNRVPSSVKRATNIATPSHYVRQKLEDTFGNVSSRSTVVRHGMEQQIGFGATSERVLRSRFDLGDARVLFFPAITHPHKNHEFLLQLLADHWTSESLKLVMAGGQGLADDQVERRIVELGLRGRAIRIGRVDNNDRDGFIQMAEAVVFPSMYEGFGAPVVEAMALGTPVISSDCAALPEVVGDAGLVLPLRSEMWSSALEVVSHRRDDLIARGTARAAQFTAAKSAEDLCVAYESTLAAARGTK